MSTYSQIPDNLEEKIKQQALKNIQKIGDAEIQVREIANQLNTYNKAVVAMKVRQGGLLERVVPLLEIIGITFGKFIVEYTDLSASDAFNCRRLYRNRQLLEKTFGKDLKIGLDTAIQAIQTYENPEGDWKKYYDNDIERLNQDKFMMSIRNDIQKKKLVNQKRKIKSEATKALQEKMRKEQIDSKIEKAIEERTRILQSELASEKVKSNIILQGVLYKTNNEFMMALGHIASMGVIVFTKEEDKNILSLKGIDLFNYIKSKTGKKTDNELKALTLIEEDESGSSIVEENEEEENEAEENEAEENVGKEENVAKEENEAEENVGKEENEAEENVAKEENVAEENVAKEEDVAEADVAEAKVSYDELNGDENHHINKGRPEDKRWTYKLIRSLFNKPQNIKKKLFEETIKEAKKDKKTLGEVIIILQKFKFILNE